MFDEKIDRQQSFQLEETITVFEMEMKVREQLMNNLVSAESVLLSELFESDDRRYYTFS